MHIVFFHDSPLPVLKYGGTERIIYWLMLDLVELGHRVTLIGHPDSKLDGSGIKLIPHIENTDLNELIPNDADIIHLFYDHHRTFKVPHIITIEGNGVPGETFDLNTVFVSKKHAENHGAETFVYNGIRLSEYPFNPEKKLFGNTFAFLAKASWKVKNVKDCVKACRAQKKHLNICGGKVFSLSRYIHNQGMVDDMKKREVLSKSDALLFPVRWHEPFGIAVVEAMAYGLPVIASPYGSLPELVHHDVGIVVHNYQELFQALEKIKNFDPLVIREYVETNFSSRKMADDYVRVYSKVINGLKLNNKTPAWVYPNPADTLLPF